MYICGRVYTWGFVVSLAFLVPPLYPYGHTHPHSDATDEGRGDSYVACRDNLSIDNGFLIEASPTSSSARYAVLLFAT